MSTQRKKTKNEIIVLDKVKVIDVYNDFVTPLNPKKYMPMSDERITSLCPFHVDTDPSLRYWKQKGIFHCFGCGFGGDAIKTYIQLRRVHYGDNIDLKTAIKFLANHYGVELLDEEEGFEEQSVFERARNNMLNKEAYKLPSTVVTIAEFRKMNKRVVNSRANLKTKIDNYAHLDLITSINLNERK